MYEVARKEVLNLLDAGLINPISYFARVSPVQVVPKKGGITTFVIDKNEVKPTRTFTGQRVGIDYRRMDDDTRKSRFLLPFIDKMLECLKGQHVYYFLDHFNSFFQIPIASEDQDKAMFTCPFGTFAYLRMPFEL